MADQPDETFAEAFAIGAATGLPLLAKMLASKGILDGGEVEIIRHSALLGFDELRERRPEFSPETIARLEEARAGLEQLWWGAVGAAAERRG